MDSELRTKINEVVRPYVHFNHEADEITDRIAALVGEGKGWKPVSEKPQPGKPCVLRPDGNSDKLVAVEWSGPIDSGGWWSDWTKNSVTTYDGAVWCYVDPAPTEKAMAEGVEIRPTGFEPDEYSVWRGTYGLHRGKWEQGAATVFSSHAEARAAALNAPPVPRGTEEGEENGIPDAMKPRADDSNQVRALQWQVHHLADQRDKEARRNWPLEAELTKIRHDYANAEARISQLEADRNELMKLVVAHPAPAKGEEPKGRRVVTAAYRTCTINGEGEKLWTFHGWSGTSEHAQAILESETDGGLVRIVDARQIVFVESTRVITVTLDEGQPLKHEGGEVVRPFNTREIVPTPDERPVTRGEMLRLADAIQPERVSLNVFKTNPVVEAIRTTFTPGA